VVVGDGRAHSDVPRTKGSLAQPFSETELYATMRETARLGMSPG
jgi:hypothetical protein